MYNIQELIKNQMSIDKALLAFDEMYKKNIFNRKSNIICVDLCKKVSISHGIKTK